MRVLIDGRGVLNQLDGIGRYSLNLIRHLAAREGQKSLSVLVREDLNEATRSMLPQGMDLIPVPYAHIAPRTLYGLGKTVDALRPDLYHSLFMFQPLTLSTPGIITVHDTMWFRRPWLQASFRPLTMGLGWAYYRAAMELCVRKAARIVTPSRATKGDLVSSWASIASKVTVVAEGPDERFHRPLDPETSRKRLTDLRLHDRAFFLHVTNSKPYKNTPRVLRGFARASSRTAALLVLVGRRSSFSRTMERLVTRLGIRDKVVLPGSVTDEVLAVLLQHALGLVFPSIYEGFGLPIVEAMTCGCPVLTSDRGAMAEVAGDAALLVDPADVGAITAALLRLAEDEELRARLTRRGRERSRSFSWDAAAGAIADVYRQIAGS